MDLDAIRIVQAAVLTLADIKAELKAFDSGDANAFDVMDAVCVAVEAYRATLNGVGQHQALRKEAA